MAARSERAAIFMMFTVRLAHGDGWREFAKPRQLLVAKTPAEAEIAFSAAEKALDEGCYVAGFLSYELGAAHANQLRAGALPLALLGVFDEPHAWQPENASFAIAPLLRTVNTETYARAINSIRNAIV